MSEQLAYAIVTPYTIRKSRTGAVLSRLLGRVSADLVAAGMFAPTRELAEAYAASVPPGGSPEQEKYRALIRGYIRQNFTPDSDGRRHRLLMLVFRGPDAVAELSQVVGQLRISSASGETIRDAYGDLVCNEDGSVRYFEPGVLIGDGPEAILKDLRLWLDFARTQSPLLTNTCTYQNPAKVEQTLVIIKPDSWLHQSSRPGAIIDMLSRTGLRIIACKPCQISVAQAMEFYGPVQDALRRKLAPGIGAKAREILERELGIKIPADADQALTEKVGVPYAMDQFERIVEFMSGRRPSQVPHDEWANPGRARCMALIYEGEDAVQKIRDVLGPTDPSKAPSGTIRREFGSDIMINTAHASDSPENAKREMGILRIADSQFVPAVEKALKEI
ncbi:MAG: nucleoside-diphosphate kinase [Lentisphaeria bacterium]